MKQYLKLINEARNQSELTTAIDVFSANGGKIFGANANRIQRAIADKRTELAQATAH